MLEFSEVDIRERVLRDNPWWSNPEYVIPESRSAKRVYFEPLKKLALNFAVRRATVLLGPRRVGKTFIVKQLIHDAISSGLRPTDILYASIDAPIYSAISLEKFLSYMPEGDDTHPRLVIFDEIQYLRDWEVHLKDLVDRETNIKFLVSGSAAAALQLRSRESGAGRFSDFMLPPLTFYEFLLFLGEEERFIRKVPTKPNDRPRYETIDIDGLNTRFVDYLNFGGYPEAVMNVEIRNNAEQFIKNDIIDKVLLNDLPGLYGVGNTQELKKLFAFLAYNAGNEASFENICQGSGIPKPTIKRYIEYLESAFLIIKLSTVDDNCRTMQRERNFKIYLNNPSMRAAFFVPVSANDPTKVGQLTECAIFSQWQHARPFFNNLRYARWKDGEVDIVFLLSENQKPRWIGEIKWSDRIQSDMASEVKNLSVLLRKHPTINEAIITTKSVELQNVMLDGRFVNVIPSAAYCYLLGRNLTDNLRLPIIVPQEEAA